jgi:glycosyltransferase involved in cell wall biosynthesis
MPKLKFMLDNIKNEIGVIHINGVWNLYNIQALLWAHKNKIPTVWTVHGELDPFRVNLKPWKKKPFLFVMLTIYKKFVTLVRAITDDERMDLLRRGFTQPVIKIPNGVHVIKYDAFLDKDTCKINLGIEPSNKVLLFVSRLSPEKGISELVRVFNNLSKDHPDWILVIAGSKIGASRKWFNKLMSKIESNDKIKYLGHWPAKEKEKLFKAADCFVLPTYSDVMSLVVLEASLFGVPSIITKGCNFPELVKTGGAFLVSHLTLHKELKNIMYQSNETFNKMGVAAKEFVVKNYNWDMIGKQMSEVYKKLMESR